MLHLAKNYLYFIHLINKTHTSFHLTIFYTICQQNSPKKHLSVEVSFLSSTFSPQELRRLLGNDRNSHIIDDSLMFWVNFTFTLSVTKYYKV